MPNLKEKFVTFDVQTNTGYHGLGAESTPKNSP